MKGGDPLSLPTPCQSNTKVTPGGGTEQREDQGRGEKEPERERLTESFLCLPHCLPARSLPRSSYLAVHPLTSSQRPLSFFFSFVALPPSHSLFTSFCLAGIYSEMITPPSSLHLPPCSLLGYLSTFKHVWFFLSPSVLPLILSLHYYYQNGCCGNTFI